jgi:tRNA threonylcarbamoyladenosine biosynthesis protein TsaB
MLVLALDTAGPDCAVAVARGDAATANVLAQSSERIGRSQAEGLMPMIEAALSEAGVVFEHLSRIAVTTGPGSFTGLRIGVATARGLALALDIPAVGVGSLQALALPLVRAARYGTVAAALDAKRSEVFGFIQDAASGEVLVESSAFPIAHFALLLRRFRMPLTLTGSGAPLVAEAAGNAGLEVAGIAESPDIADVALLGLKAAADAPPTPLYARGADAKPQHDKALARL